MMVDYDGLINYFTDLFHECLEKTNGQEGNYNAHLFGKAAAYLDIVNTLTELKNEVEDLPHDTR